MNRRLSKGESPEELIKDTALSFPTSPSELAASLEKLSARFVGRDDTAFPAVRLGVLGDDTPLGLFLRGSLDLSEALAAPCVALVGTRNATDYGKRTAFALAEELAGRGVTIISGLALGIDTAAHEGALEANGKTLAILGPGVDVVYPSENQKLFDSIVSRGLLISETPPGHAPEPYLFPLRNRIISALADAVVVVESDTHGGAMITAKLARAQGRPLFAVPGRIDQRLSAGPNSLIRTGAGLITCAQDLLEALAQKSQQPELFGDAALSSTTSSKASAHKKSSRAQKATIPANLPAFLRPLVEGDSLTAEALAERAGLPVHTLLPRLLEYELLGSLGKNLDGTYQWRG